LSTSWTIVAVAVVVIVVIGRFTVAVAMGASTATIIFSIWSTSVFGWRIIIFVVVTTSQDKIASSRATCDIFVLFLDIFRLLGPVPTAAVFGHFWGLKKTLSLLFDSGLVL
jgi:hypothetical protein